MITKSLQSDSPVWESKRYSYLAPDESRDSLVHALFNDRRAMLPHVEQLFGMDRDAVRRRRQSQRKGMREGSSFFVDVISKEDSSLVAVSGFRELKEGAGEWGAIVDPVHRRKGAASEIFASNVDMAKSLLKSLRIVAATTAENQIMISFLSKRGLREAKKIDGDNGWLRFEAPIRVIQLKLSHRGGGKRQKEHSSADSEMVAFMLKTAFFSFLLLICISPVETSRVVGRGADLMQRLRSVSSQKSGVLLDVLSDINMGNLVGEGGDDVQDVRGRMSRARLPLWFSLPDADADDQRDGMMSARVLSFPDSQGLPLQSHPASSKVFLKVLSGEFLLQTLSTENVEGSSTLDADEEEEDGSIDDCVCRGGRCPRRWGCKFWVETMSKRTGVRVNASRLPPATLSQGSPCLFLGDSVPFSLIATKGSAALLEVVITTHDDPAPSTYYQIISSQQAEDGDVEHVRLQLLSDPAPGTPTTTYVGELE